MRHAHAQKLFSSPSSHVLLCHTSNPLRRGDGSGEVLKYIQFMEFVKGHRTAILLVVCLAVAPALLHYGFRVRYVVHEPGAAVLSALCNICAIFRFGVCRDSL